jgi:hypothetical protein
MTRDARLTKALFLRVSEEDVDRLDALAQRIPVATKNALARTAMRLGLELLEKDPARVIAEPLPRRGRKKLDSA